MTPVDEIFDESSLSNALRFPPLPIEDTKPVASGFVSSQSRNARACDETTGGCRSGRVAGTAQTTLAKKAAVARFLTRSDSSGPVFASANAPAGDKRQLDSHRPSTDASSGGETGRAPTDGIATTASCCG